MWVSFQLTSNFLHVRTYMRLPHGQGLEEADVAVFGVPFDSGVSLRPGARFGPAAIRDESIILKPYCPLTDVNIVENISVLDYGDVDTVPGYIEESVTVHQHPIFVRSGLLA